MSVNPMKAITKERNRASETNIDVRTEEPLSLLDEEFSSDLRSWMFYVDVPPCYSKSRRLLDNSCSIKILDV